MIDGLAHASRLAHFGKMEHHVIGCAVFRQQIAVGRENSSANRRNPDFACILARCFRRIFVAGEHLNVPEFDPDYGVDRHDEKQYDADSQKRLYVFRVNVIHR